MTDTKPPEPPTLADALDARERLETLLGLLGVRATLQVVPYGDDFAVAVMPLWLGDVRKLADALSKVPEIRPYVGAKPQLRRDDAA